ncbi:hypothetical protein SGRIM128S_06748 [Streptomyces griseomycini]
MNSSRTAPSGRSYRSTGTSGGPSGTPRSARPSGSEGVPGSSGRARPRWTSNGAGCPRLAMRRTEPSPDNSATTAVANVSSPVPPSATLASRTRSSSQRTTPGRSGARRAASWKVPSSALTVRTAPRPLPRTSAIISRTPWGVGRIAYRSPPMAASRAAASYRTATASGPIRPGGEGSIARWTVSATSRAFFKLPPLTGQHPVEDRGQEGQGDERRERDDVVDAERQPAPHQRQDHRGEERRPAGGDRPGQGEPGRDQHGGGRQQGEHPHASRGEEVEDEHAEDQCGRQPSKPPPFAGR